MTLPLEIPIPTLSAQKLPHNEHTEVMHQNKKASKADFCLKQYISTGMISYFSATAGLSVFDEHAILSDHLSCFSHIRDLYCICPYLDCKPASTITT